VGDRAARRNGSTGRVFPGRWYYAIALLTQRWTLRAWNLPLAEALGNPHDHLLGWRGVPACQVSPVTT
jgi:hypothetical protein